MEFILRPWTTDDLENLVLYANNPKIAGNLSDSFPYPFTTEFAHNFIQQASTASPENRLAIVVDGQAIGNIGIHPQSDIQCKNAEIGYWLGEPFWGKGIMSRVIPQMVDYSFANFDIERIFARCFGANTGSHRALEHAGFILEGSFEKTLYKRGVYHDELIYAVRRSTWAEIEP